MLLRNNRDLSSQIDLRAPVRHEGDDSTETLFDPPDSEQASGVYLIGGQQRDCARQEASSHKERMPGAPQDGSGLRLHPDCVWDGGESRSLLSDGYEDINTEKDVHKLSSARSHSTTLSQSRSAFRHACASSRIRLGVLLLVCVTILALANPLWVLQKAVQSHGYLPQSVAAGNKDAATCEDPWALPGYTWYGEGTRDVRYIPYKYIDGLANSSVVDILNPEKHFEASHANSLPSDIPFQSQLSEMFRSTTSRENQADELEFIRNRHIVALGSSLDREAVRNFCVQHGAKIEYKHHRHAYCHFKEYNLTISQWMHFGIHQSTWHKGDDETKAGLTVEDRVRKNFLPLVEKFGKPDLLLFSSGLWDLQYMHRVARKHDGKLSQDTFQSLTYNELAWHRARLAGVIGFLQEIFPESVLMYRTTTETSKHRSETDDEPISIFQLNQSAKALMKKLRIPLFNWSDLVRGNNEHVDIVHFRRDSRPNWLYGEMMLWHLKQIVEGTQDPACWVDR